MLPLYLPQDFGGHGKQVKCIFLSLFQSHASRLIQIDIYARFFETSMTPYDLQCMHFRFESPLLPVCGQVWILVLRKAYGLTFQTQ